MPKIRLQITKPDGTVQSVVTRKKMKVVSIIVRELATEWILEVIYKQGVSNVGNFTSKEDVQKALASWTTQDQIDFVKDGEWE